METSMWVTVLICPYYIVASIFGVTYAFVCTQAVWSGCWACHSQPVQGAVAIAKKWWLGGMKTKRNGSGVQHFVCLYIYNCGCVKLQQYMLRMLLLNHWDVHAFVSRLSHHTFVLLCQWGRMIRNGLETKWLSLSIYCMLHVYILLRLCEGLSSIIYKVLGQQTEKLDSY